MLSKTRSQTIARTILLFLLTTVPSWTQVSVNQAFFTTSDGVKLRYLEAGQGPAILLVPGWLMPADIWEPQFRAFSKDFHVVALDPRSQGLSDITTHGNDPLRRSQDLQELMDHLKLDSAVMVGWAMGAFDALAYLRQYGADNLTALVLVDSPLGAPSAPPTQRGSFLKLFQTDRQQANQNYVWGLFKKKQSRGFYQTLVQSAGRVPTDTALAMLDNTSPGDNWEPGPKALRSVPILYAITPKYQKQAGYLQQVAPQAKVELFENAGHALFVDDADHFNIVLRNFLQQPTAPAVIPTPKPSTSPLTKINRPTPILPTPTPASLSWLERLQQKFSSFQPAEAPTLTPTVVQKFRPQSTPTDTMTPSPLIAVLSPTPSPLMPTMTNTLTPVPVPTSTPTLLPPQPSPVLESPSQPNPSLEAPPKAYRPTAGQHAFYAVPVQDGFFATSDHVKLHYLEAGTGLTLIFIPGWLLPAEIWKSQLEELSDDYHVVALDPRSQGRSDITPRGDEPLRQARDIQELMDHLHVQSAVLVGWSHGAFQVLAYMGEFGTDRLYAAVLVDSALGAGSSPASESRSRFLEGFKIDRVTATRSFIWGLFKRHPSADFIRLLSDSALRTPTDIALTLMNSAFPGDPWQPSLPVMRQIPLLYAVTPKYIFQSQYLLQVDPLARVEMFQNTGHALFVDDPGHFNNTLRDFLRQAALYKSGLPEPQRKATPAIPGAKH